MTEQWTAVFEKTEATFVPKFMAKLGAPNCEVLPLPRGLWLEVTDSSVHCELWRDMGSLAEPSPISSTCPSPSPAIDLPICTHLPVCLFFYLSVRLQYFCSHLKVPLLRWLSKAGSVSPPPPPHPPPRKLPSHQSALWKHSLPPWICSLTNSHHLGSVMLLALGVSLIY